MENVLSSLVGKKILGISVSVGEEYLAFHTDGGELWFMTYGDCCSETWFADLIGTKNLLDQVVQKVEDISMPSWYNINDKRCRQEEDSWYGHNITTALGVATLVYRNSSNGYYGGDISEMNSRPGDEGKRIKMRVLFNDWSA